jgi:hypothetical protein
VLRVFPPELFVAAFSPVMGHDGARAFVTRRYGA